MVSLCVGKLFLMNDCMCLMFYFVFVESIKSGMDVVGIWWSVGCCFNGGCSFCVLFWVVMVYSRF